MIAIVAISLITFLIGASLYSFVFQKSYRNSYFSYEIFYTLICVYFGVLIGFGLLYFVLSFNGVLLVEGGVLQDTSQLETLAHSLYFSGVTLMTVGYGDITPIGWGRLLALIEALIGYILPAAFFLRIMQNAKRTYSDQEVDKERAKEL
ncbi:ion channel [Radiobacillus sp. PE A8.2]|uniref:potassium channel family protein n=1 Tax=Radiobacillus sp. PE A8.2 TaxID=3380349 RepID=UPI00388D30EB